MLKPCKLLLFTAIACSICPLALLGSLNLKYIRIDNQTAYTIKDISLEYSLKKSNDDKKGKEVLEPKLTYNGLGSVKYYFYKQASLADLNKTGKEAFLADGSEKIAFKWNGMPISFYAEEGLDRSLTAEEGNQSLKVKTWVETDTFVLRIEETKK